MIAQPTAEQIEKLPKWAQQHLNDCTRRCNDARKELIKFLDGQTESNVYHNGRAIGIADKHFIQDDEVTFVLKSGEIGIRIDGDSLRVMAHGPCTQLHITPSVTNVVVLTIT